MKDVLMRIKNDEVHTLIEGEGCFEGTCGCVRRMAEIALKKLGEVSDETRQSKDTGSTGSMQD